jgi:hypothetical protein
MGSLPSIPVVGPILDGIAGLLGGSSGDSNTAQVALNEVWARTAVVAGLQYAGLSAVNDALGKAAKVISRGFQHVIEDLIHLKFLHLFQDIIALLHRIKLALAPLLAWLRKLQAMQRQLQLHQLKVIIDTIQKVRAFLAVLKFFHVKWATKLDNWLAGVEGRLISRELNIAQKTNEILDWVNLVADPTGLFRFAPAAMSLGRMFDSLLRIITGFGVDHWFVDHSANASPLPPQSSYPAFYRQLTADIAAGSGNVTALRSHFTTSLATMKARQ